MSLRILYCGPPMAGKTTNLLALSRSLRNQKPMHTRATSSDRTLFAPLVVPALEGEPIDIELVTMPGAVFYKESWTKLFSGVDGIVFVADSQHQQLANAAGWIEKMTDHMRLAGLGPEVPIVYQANKQDLPDVATPDEVGGHLGFTMRGASAMNRRGVIETLRDLIDRSTREDAQRIDWSAFHGPEGG